MSKAQIMADLTTLKRSALCRESTCSSSSPPAMVPSFQSHIMRWTEKVLKGRRQWTAAVLVSHIFRFVFNSSHVDSVSSNPLTHFIFASLTFNDIFITKSLSLRCSSISFQPLPISIPPNSIEITETGRLCHAARMSFTWHLRPEVGLFYHMPT